MEGMNLGAMYLIALIVLVAGLLSLVALVSLLLGKFGLARLAFATGLLASAILAALASLTYLKDAGNFAPQGAGLIFTAMAAVLLLAGWGQLRAAIAFPGRYLISLALSLAAVGLLPLAIPIGDLFRASAVANMKFDGLLVFMVLIFSIGLGVASCVVALPPTETDQKPESSDLG
jgi:hypothetical protein